MCKSDEKNAILEYNQSPNQNINYFKSQNRNVVSNDAIMARLFIGTLKGVAFELFMKLSAGSIKIWANLEKLFLACFFEDDTEIQCQLPLQQNKRKESLSNCLWKYFGVWSSDVRVA